MKLGPSFVFLANQGGFVEPRFAPVALGNPFNPQQNAGRWGPVLEQANDKGRGLIGRELTCLNPIKSKGTQGNC